MGLHIVDTNFNPPSKWLLLARSFAVIIPWFAMFFILLQMFLSNFQVVYVNNFLFSLCLIISLLWHDVVFFNNKRLLVHDLLTNTRVIFDNADRDETFAERVIPNPARAWEKLKAWYYRSMQEIKSLKETNKK
ncbi:MAG: hypothetical protein Ta2D_07790 [Rickettsiales bacterium]|nr:MAG: hypothetical protein Ta2D_07790 [Rickettsiales bacterium]